MRILVDIGHPGHVHFFKHAISKWQQRGHDVLVSAREKDVTTALLNHYAFPYRILSAIGHGRRGMAREFLQREWALRDLIHEFDPHVVTEVGGVFMSLAIALAPGPITTPAAPVAVEIWSGCRDCCCLSHRGQYPLWLSNTVNTGAIGGRSHS